MAKMLCCGRRQNDCCQITGKAPTGKYAGQQGPGKHSPSPSGGHDCRRYEHKVRFSKFEAGVCRKCNATLWKRPR